MATTRRGRPNSRARRHPSCPSRASGRSRPTARPTSRTCSRCRSRAHRRRPTTRGRIRTMATHRTHCPSLICRMAYIRRAIRRPIITIIRLTIKASVMSTPFDPLRPYLSLTVCPQKHYLIIFLLIIIYIFFYWKPIIRFIESIVKKLIFFTLLYKNRNIVSNSQPIGLK